MTYLIDYKLGDKVTAYFAGARADAKIKEIVIVADGPVYQVRAGFDVESLWDSRLVILCGSLEDTALCRSIDGGLTWSVQQKFDFDDDWIYRTLILANGNILAAVEDGVAGTGEVWRSTDQGVTWSLLTDTLDNAVYSLEQMSTGDIFAGTYRDAEIWRSQDNGVSWVLVKSIPGESTVRCLAESANGNLLAGTSNRAQIWRSTNGGTTWNLVKSIAGELFVLSILLLDDNDLLACTGRGGEIWRSQDNGATWIQLSTIAGEQLPGSLLQIPDGTLLCGGYTKIYYSKDKGVTWATALAMASGFGDMRLTDDGVMAVTNYGPYFYESTDGQSWSEIQVTIPPPGGVTALAWIGEIE